MTWSMQLRSRQASAQPPHFSAAAGPSCCTLCKHSAMQRNSWRASPAAAPLCRRDGAQLLRALVDEQRRVSQLPARRRRVKHAGRQAIARVVHEALRGAAGQRQTQALARRAQDLGLPWVIDPRLGTGYVAVAGTHRQAQALARQRRVLACHRA